MPYKEHHWTLYHIEFSFGDNSHKLEAHEVDVFQAQEDPVLPLSRLMRRSNCVEGQEIDIHDIIT
jgi:hypothetical protein